MVNTGPAPDVNLSLNGLVLMLRRVVLVVAVVAILVAALVYSRQQQDPLSVSGFVEADEIRLGSRVGGRVAEVLCEEGEAIAAGTPLVRLEEFDLEERKAEAEAKLAAQTAEFQRLQAGLRDEETAQAKARFDRLSAVLEKLRRGPREEEINAARARVELAEAQAERVQKTYNRIVELFRQESAAVTREDVDRATEDLTVAEKNREVRDQELQLLLKGTREEDLAAAGAEREEARQAWELAKKGYRQEDIQAAKSSVDAAQAALDAIKAQIDELTIFSPVAGVVEAVELQPGDLVAAGAPVLSVMDLNHLWVRAYVPEDRLTVQLGQPVQITTDSYPDRKFRGEVTFIASQAEFTPNNVQTPEERSKQVFRIKVTLLDGLDVLRPGMPVDVGLEGGDSEARIPSS
jgi:multidrug resistance efflux pump